MGVDRAVHRPDNMGGSPIWRDDELSFEHVVLMLVGHPGNPKCSGTWMSGLWRGVWVRAEVSHWGGCVGFDSQGMNEGNVECS